jgi:glycosyltransferase involved in cell wall biosynthesis
MDDGERQPISPDSAGLPKVTAVIPAYNMASFIERALCSAIGQTYANLEVIVIDDGSDDETATIAQRVASEHSNVRVVSTDNAGVAAARNLGTQMADSLYVAYLDADDVWHPLKITRQVAALAAHGHSSEWGACYALHRTIDSHDRVLGNGPASQERGAFFEEHLVWNPIGNGSTLLVRRDLALVVGGFNSDYARAGIGGCEDLEFQLKVLRRSKMEVVREFLVGYRLHSAQMSGDGLRMRLSRLAVVEKILADCEMSERIRTRALVQAYVTAANGYVRARDWRAAAKWTRAALLLSPVEMAKVFGRIFGRKLGSSSSRDAASLQPFGTFDPCDGVDAQTGPTS